MIRHGLGIQGRREQAAALHHASRALSPPRPRLIQGEGEAEGCLAFCRMGPAVRALPHGPCIPRLCCVHALLLMPCRPHAPLIQKASEAETKAIGMVSLYVCIPVHFSAFFLKNFLLIPLYLFYLFFIKKVEKQTEAPQTLVSQRFPGVYFFASPSPFCRQKLPLRTQHGRAIMWYKSSIQRKDGELC